MFKNPFIDPDYVKLREAEVRLQVEAWAHEHFDPKFQIEMEKGLLVAVNPLADALVDAAPTDEARL